MTRSMTGFGRASADIDNESVTIEVNAVNHRFLECSFRLPGIWAALESDLRSIVKKHVARGKVTISLRRGRGAVGRPVIRFDEENARQYIDASRELSHMMNSTEALSLDVLVQLDGVFFRKSQSRIWNAPKRP